MDRSIFRNNYLILAILMASVMFYAYFYSQSVTEFTVIIDSMKQGAGSMMTGTEENTIDSFLDIMTSMYFQVPLQFVNTLLIIYILSIFILIFNKTENKVRKISQERNSFKDIVTCFYKSIYVVAANFIVLGLFMMMTNVSLKTMEGVTPGLYWLLIGVLQAYVFGKEFYKRNTFTYSPVVVLSIYLTLGFTVQMFLNF
ncbi:hypothetical protein [Halobacillus sp. B23F22_1]|uniref:hypothetical protein n=1 Tax=Halobacillus sp. B23F22_1 TaxID=3459514 RepID=UPI00373E573B